MESISESNGVELVSDDDINILSVGISTSGSAEIKMAKKNQKSHIIATTIDEDGIKLTQNIIEENHLNNQITLKLEDISKKLDYENDYFDYVYARLVLHYLDNQNLANALSEINRILKPNGKLFVVVRSVNAWEINMGESSYDEITGITKHQDLRTLGTPNYIYRRFHTVESITEFLQKANFKIDYTKVYNEFLSPDFERKDMNDYPSELIEVLARKA